MPVRCAAVTWLLCDYGEVISLPQPPDDLAAVESAAGVTDRDTFWASYWHHRPKYDRSDVTAERYWQDVLGRAVDPDQLEEVIAADVRSWLHPNPASLEAVSRLKDEGIRLALFSNAPLELARELQGAPWLEPFSRKFFSCELRAAKPDRDAYRAVIDDLGAQPADVVFVDDRPANVAGASAVGMRAFLFESPGQLAALL